ncbi:hypothetical protein GTR02_09760 [Kineococcus sp. R8]|uniref:hypothetical protein n=1 Tax=Kineococcus siccus TaxID=2696567 RepID=UPI00141273E4|nr:hypothetical protein [Kineococcus siccus]NAZ82102.1 hypothetical protein [Kineococcus siccus]
MPTDGDASARSADQPLRLMGFEVEALPAGVTARAVVAAIKTEDPSGCQTWTARTSADATQDMVAAQRVISAASPTTGEQSSRTTTQRMVGKALAATARGAVLFATWFWWITASLVVVGLLVGAVNVTFSEGGSWWFGLLLGGAAAAVAARWGLHARKVHRATSRRLSCP